MYYKINGNCLPQVRLIDKAILEPPYVHMKRQPEEFILYIMTKGTLFLQENGKKYTLVEGDVILLDPDYVHEGLQASFCEYFYIHFKHPQIVRQHEKCDFMENLLQERSCSLQEDGGSFERYQDSYLCFPKHFSLKMGTTYLKVVRLLQEAMEHNRNQMENYKVSCACRLMEALVEIAREAVTVEALHQNPGIPQSYERIHELLGYLNANYQRDISGKTIEEAFACNFDYLNRVFKKTIGKTIFAYLNEIRIQHAREMLVTTSMKVSAIGYRVGYRDECYFNKVFKRWTGVTPGKYVKMTKLSSGSSLGSPFSGTPSVEIGKSAEELVHAKCNPAADETESQPDSQQIREKNTHAPTGNHRYNHWIENIPGTTQRVLLDVVEASPDF